MSTTCLNRFLPACLALWLFGVGGCGGYGSKVKHGNLEVYYTEGATKEEADRLGAYLIKMRAGAGEASSVQLKKAGEGYQYRMVMKKEFQNDEKTLTRLEFDGARISRDVFDGAAVEVHVCDEHFTTVKALPPRADLRYGVVEGKAEVFYPAGFDKAEAQNFVNYSSKLFAALPAPASFKLVRRGKVLEVHMATNLERAKEPGQRAELRNFGQQLSLHVFKNSPVEMHLCDDLLNEVEVLGP